MIPTNIYTYIYIHTKQDEITVCGSRQEVAIKTNLWLIKYMEVAYFASQEKCQGYYRQTLVLETRLSYYVVSLCMWCRHSCNFTNSSNNTAKSQFLRIRTLFLTNSSQTYYICHTKRITESIHWTSSLCSKYLE